MAQNEELTLTAQQQEYLDWLCTAPSERVPPSKHKMATHLGVNETTLRRWEKKEVFRKQWQTAVDAVQGSPERTQTLLDTLYAKALDGDTKSAQLYLQATNRMAPPTVTVQSSKKAAELTDEELDSLIAAVAEREKSSRTQLKAV
jgi:DNA-binding transcriptional MerR regulator